jgi:hypothetical protein
MHNWLELESLLTDGIAHRGSKPAGILLSSQMYDSYEHALAVTNAVDYVEWMEEKKKIDTETAENLKTMLNSEDRDNFTIAILAIEELKK